VQHNRVAATTCGSGFSLKTITSNLTPYAQSIKCRRKKLTFMALISKMVVIAAAAAAAGARI
jgi:hypothetical protein